MKKFFKGHKVLSITLAMILVASLSIGTYALFVDHGDVAANVTAGTLDLTVNGSNEAQVINVTNMQPGDRSNFTWILRNAGSVNATLGNGTFSISQTGGAAALAPELYGDANNNGNLSTVLFAAVYIDGVEVLPSRPISNLVGSMPFSGLNKSLAAYTSCELTIQVYWPAGGTYDENMKDNTCQGDTLSGTATFNLIQAI